MGFIAPDLTGSLHGKDFKPAIETILRELNGKLSSDNIEEINANQVNGTNINANNITSGQIDASNIDVLNLNADNIVTGAIDATEIGVTNINADNITAGTLTGRTVQTASSGARVVVDGINNRVSIYDSTRERMRLVGDKLFFYDENGNDAGFIQGVFDSILGSVLALAASSIYIGQNALVFDNITNDQIIMYEDNSATLVLEGGDFYVNGDVGGDTKSFIITHPFKQNKKLRYVCPEFPEVLAMCRGNGDVVLPDHFEAITVPESRQTIKDKENGNWIVTGVRIGYEDFDCEPDIKDSSPESRLSRKEVLMNDARLKKNQSEVQETDTK